MEQIKRILLIVLLSVAFSNGIFSVQYPVVNYQTSDGIPQNNVNALIQDMMGYIYVGTQSGIGKFNGNEFEIITIKNGLSHNFINDMAIDTNGHIWVATQEGLSRIHPHGDISIYLEKEFINSISYDKKSHTLWIVTRSAVFSLDIKTTQFSPYFIPGFESLTQKNDKEEIPIKKVKTTSHGTLFFYYDHYIIVVNQEKAELIEAPAEVTTISSRDLKDNPGIIVVGTKDGLFLLDNHQLTPFLQLPPENLTISAVTFDEKESLWIGTKNGLLFFENPGASPTLINDNTGLTNNEITGILVDREKNVLVGTTWGLSLVSRSLFKMYHQDDGLPDKFVWCFFEDTGSILLGCTNGLAELRDDKIYTFPINKRLKHFSIRSISKLADNDYLLGTRDNGIFRWDRGEQLQLVNPDANVLFALTIQGNQVWFGTDHGLLFFNGQTFTPVKQGLKDLNVWSITQVDENTLLLATQKGVQLFDIKQKKCIPSDIEQKVKEVIVNDVRFISKSEIYIATEMEGLLIYSLTDQSLKSITSNNGLMHNDIWTVVKDDSNNLWINTSISLDRYANGFVSHFNKKTGLFGDEGTIHSALKTSSGDIFISIVPGFLVIPSRQAVSDIVSPILYIKEVKVNNKKIDILDNIPFELPHHQNSLEFHYIAVSTRKENPIYYKTRLYPLEKKWSEPTEEIHIKYASLPPNDYTFEVIANNSGREKQWLQSKNKISFTIDKPFWLTWWFILLMIIAGFFLVFLVIKIRLKSLEKQKRTLERLIQERTEELGLRNKQLAYLSVTDPLTDLKNRRYLEEKIKEDISLIERNIFQYVNAITRSENIPPVLGVFILDIDFFKQVNDNYGHKAGDIVIVNIAKLLLEMLRNSDTIVRWGGEEFLIITRQSNKGNTFELAERIRKKIEEFEFSVDDHVIIKKTVSVGYAHFPFIPFDTKTVNWTQVVSLADSALYIAKNNGRNTCVGIEWADKDLKIDFKDIVSDIKLGLDKKYLKLISLKKNLKVIQSKAQH